MPILAYATACPQCSHEQDYFKYMGLSSSKEYSEYYTRENPCPLCNNTHTVSMVKYLLKTGNARRAFELEYLARK